jgi:hypothetical protein
MEKTPEDAITSTRRTAYLPAYRVTLVRDGSVRIEDRPTVRDASGAAKAIISARIPVDDGREHFGILLLDVRHRITGSVEVSVGCLASSLVHPAKFLVRQSPTRPPRSCCSTIIRQGTLNRAAKTSP